MPHGFEVDGNKLRTLRKKAGLTQEQLAKLADCSDRLIRKAESGGSLKLEIIDQIARQLSKKGEAAEWHDLVLSHQLGCRQVAEKFMKAYDCYGNQMLDHVSALTDEVSLVFPGDPELIPFAGIWVGAWYSETLRSILRPLLPKTKLFEAHLLGMPRSCWRQVHRATVLQRTLAS